MIVALSSFFACHMAGLRQRLDAFEQYAKRRRLATERIARLWADVEARGGWVVQ